LQAIRRPGSAVGNAALARPAQARHTPADTELRRRVEPITPRRAPVRRIFIRRKPQTKLGALRSAIEQNLLLISAALLCVGLAGWCLALYNEFRGSGLFGQASVYAESGLPDASVDKADAVGISSYARSTPAGSAAPTVAVLSPLQPGTESATSRVVRDWGYFDPKRTAGLPARTADVPRIPAKPAKAVAAAPPAQPVRTASAEAPTPQMLSTAPSALPIPSAPRLPPNIEAKTSLVDFDNAPFPYRGTLPGSNRPFLDAGEHTGHVNFRGRVFTENRTYSDDHVLLHIPSGFDPNRPAVMVVFFHGHGATLARDVRDRQRLPDQISAAGLNAVLVAPQFAYDAADSSSGKFWEPDGFKRFLDEAAKRLATMYGDQRSAASFANMPIVLVSYSGGFGPTLSVLARGGAQQRIRGLVLLDSLYAGIDQFADWIADHRNTFFISSYTPHTAHHNADLEHALAERSVPYSSNLRRDHLPGMVTFLPTGDISHRDFVNRAWADYPVEDILLRMSDTVPVIDPPTVASANAAHH
jgi:hypothetical protein